MPSPTPPPPAPPRRALDAVRSTLAPTGPVARPLTTATMATSLSSGLFYTVSALFFTTVVGLGATTVGLGLTVAGAVGVAGSFGAGYLADRVGASRLLLGATLGQGLALLAYVLATSTTAFVVTACCAVGFRSMQGTARQAVLARTSTGPERMAVRARLRVVTNVFIGLGTVLAGAALLVGTAAAYRSTMLLAGALVLASCVPLARLVRGAGPPPEPLDLASATTTTPTAPTTTGRSPLRDRTYLAVTGLNAVMAMQFGLQTVGVPLWVVTRTPAPPVTVSALLVLNTVLIACFQVRASRGTDDVRAAGRAVARGGVLLALACGLHAAAATGSVVLAVVLLVLAATAHTAAEMLTEAGSWGLAFELADPRSAGAYQGVSQTGYSIGTMLAPLVVTATAVDHGTPGWALLGTAFATVGALTWVVARTARRPEAAQVLQHERG
ncbi:MFS transporter [uncultured Pseudokineococcus sp.]|uniref:MFS transporter n=1 Tax=uncultured Pseudokineococcus sp. TaxID=1642928 RepID=UPI002622034B|nr:MFS transporter [uncultured Pseudokineococcus sp.]